MGGTNVFFFFLLLLAARLEREMFLLSVCSAVLVLIERKLF